VKFTFPGVTRLSDYCQIPMTGWVRKFSTREEITYTMNKGSLSPVLLEESDLEDTSFSSCSNVSSTVRKQINFFNYGADSAAKVYVDGTDDRSHFFKSVVTGGRGTYVPFPSHSFLTPIGPTAWVLMLDCRCVDYNLR
jgi:hypothetical protein